MVTQERDFKLFSIFAGLFVAALVISNVMAVKIVNFGWLQISGATILFPLSYIFGDILTEVYGYSRSRKVIWTGLASMILLSFTSWLVTILPPASFWQGQEAFETIFSLTPRIALASIAAYWLGEFSNSYVLSRMEYIEKGKRGLIQAYRFILSTVVGEGVDSILFMTLAFGGIFPTNELIKTIFGIYVFKVIYETIATPFTVWFANWVKKVEGIDQIDTPKETNYSPFAILK